MDLARHLCSRSALMIGALLVGCAVACSTTPTTSASSAPTTASSLASTSAPSAPPRTGVLGQTPPLSASDLPILRADGLGSIDFGAPADPSLLTLSDVFRAKRTTGTRACGAATARTVAWPDLEVRFVDERFVGYEYHLSSSTAPTAPTAQAAQAAPNYRTTEGIGLDSTTAELRAAYGDDLVVTGDGATGWTWSTRSTPTFTGRLSGPPDAPDASVVTIAAGPACS